MLVKSYAYGRVSTSDQCVDRQIDAFRKLGIKQTEIFIDKASGKDFNRPEYQRLVALLKPGDTLFIHSLDRLGRNFEEVPAEYNYLVHEKGVHVRVIGMDILDSDRAHSRNEGFVQQLILMIQSFFAESERLVMLERQKQGYEAAKARGKKLGRPCLPITRQYLEVLKLFREGTLTCREAAKRCNMSSSTFYYKSKTINV